MIGDKENEPTSIQRGQGTANSGMIWKQPLAQAVITNVLDDWRKNISPRVKIDLVRKIISALSPALSFVESPEQYQMFHTAFRQAQEVNIFSEIKMFIFFHEILFKIENDAFRRGDSVHDYYTIMANAIYIHQKEAAKEAATRYAGSNRGPKSR